MRVSMGRSRTCPAAGAYIPRGRVSITAFLAALVVLNVSAWALFAHQQHQLGVVIVTSEARRQQIQAGGGAGDAWGARDGTGVGSAGAAASGQLHDQLPVEQRSVAPRTDAHGAIARKVLEGKDPGRGAAYVQAIHAAHGTQQPVQTGLGPLNAHQAQQAQLLEVVEAHKSQPSPPPPSPRYIFAHEPARVLPDPAVAAAQTEWPVWWFAPFFDRTSFGHEAATIVLGGMRWAGAGVDGGR
jgi:hypothetical protein